jgi:hypothetical protein
MTFETVQYLKVLPVKNMNGRFPFDHNARRPQVRFSEDQEEENEPMMSGRGVFRQSPSADEDFSQWNSSLTCICFA